MFAKHEEQSFISWMRQTNTIFTGEEYKARLGIFLTNKRLVQEHNANKGFRVSMNKFAALSPAEYRSLLGFKPVSTDGVATSFNTNAAEVDWRKKGCVNPVQDQGQCGSCWAFSTVQATEGTYAAKYGKLFKLSEQQIVDCVSDCSGCNGGLMTKAFAYVINKCNGGFMSEDDYPYTGYQGTCRYDDSKAVVRIKGYKEVAKTEKDLAAACASQGPIAIAIDASQWTFQMYSSGIYDEPSCSSQFLDHAVGCVGYGKEGSTEYWIVRNSWGEDWGEQGYIRMIKDKNNQCGEASMACYPTF